jgi:hypothetical protein
MRRPYDRSLMISGRGCLSLARSALGRWAIATSRISKMRNKQIIRRTKSFPISRSGVPTVKANGWPAVFAISPTSVRRTAPSVGALIVPATGAKIRIALTTRSAPELCNPRRKQATKQSPRESYDSVLPPSNFFSTRFRQEKRRRDADKRVFQPPHLSDAARVQAARARLSAFHHGSCCSERTPQLSSRYALAGTWSGARPRWFERPCALQRTIQDRTSPAGVTRSFLSQSSEFPRRPVIVPAGRNSPKPPGSDPSRSARGHRTRPAFGRAIIWGLTEARYPCNIWPS